MWNAPLLYLPFSEKKKKHLQIYKKLVLGRLTESKPSSMVAFFGTEFRGIGDQTVDCMENSLEIGGTSWFGDGSWETWKIFISNHNRLWEIFYIVIKIITNKHTEFCEFLNDWLINTCMDCNVFSRKGSELTSWRSLNNCIRKWGRASFADIKDATSLYTFSLSSSKSRDLKKNYLGKDWWNFQMKYL